MRSIAATKQLHFINYKIIQDDHAREIERLIGDILRLRVTVDMTDSDVTNTAKLYSQEIHVRITDSIKITPTSQTNKKFVFIDSRLLVQKQKEIIELLNNFKRDGISDIEYIQFKLATYLNKKNEVSVINLFIKQISGKSIKLNINGDSRVFTVMRLLYEKRGEPQKDATFENYLKSIQLFYAGAKLHPEKLICAYGIRDGSTLQEIGNDFTMSGDFDWNALLVTDPISLEPCENPYILNPGCAHVLDKSTLKSWIEKKQHNHQTPDCPCCRTVIGDLHVAKISMWKSINDEQSGNVESYNPRININGE